MKRFDAAGRRWTLAFGFDAIRDLERDHGGQPLLAILPLANSRMTTMRALLQAGLNGGALAVAEVEALVDEIGLNRAAGYVMEALADDLGESGPGAADEEPGEPQALDYDRLLAVWVQAGQPAWAFGATPPRAFNAAMAGYAAAEKRRAWHDWRTVNQSRAEKPQDLKRYLAPLGDKRDPEDRSRGGAALIGMLTEMKARGVPVRIRRLKRPAGPDGA